MVLMLSAAFLLAVLQNSYVQSYLAKSASAILSEKLGVSIWIDKIKVSGYFYIMLSDVSMEDLYGNPMITAKSISLDFPVSQGFSDNISVNYIEIDSAYVMVKKYNEQDDINITSVFASEGDTTIIDADTTKNKPFKIKLDHLVIKQTHFIYQDATSTEKPDFGMDYAFLDISNIDLEMKDIQVVDDSIVAEIQHLSAYDKSGVQLNHLEGMANVSASGTYLENAIIETPRSLANFNLGFHYQHWSAYLDFIEEVYIDSKIKSSRINMDDIAYFAPEMKGMSNLLRLKGSVKGAVRNLKARDMEFSFGKSTSFRGDVQMTGLPDFYETFMKFDISALVTDIKDVQDFNLPNGIKISGIPPELEKFGKIIVKGKYTGFYNDFVSNANIYTDLGRLYTNIQFQNNTEEDILYYQGEFNAIDFDLGRFIDQEDDLGEINFSLNVDGKGTQLDRIETLFRGRIDSIEFRGNPINTIYVDAGLMEKKFMGTVSLSDNLIKADFNGLVDLGSQKPNFDFSATLSSVKLSQLKLIDADPSASLSSQIKMNFTGASIDEFEGDIFVDSTSFFYDDHLYQLEKFHLHSTKNQQNKLGSFKLNSDYLVGEVQGRYNFRNLGNSVEELFQEYVENIDFIDDLDSSAVREDFNFWFHIYNPSEFLPIFTNSVKISDTIKLSGNFNSSLKDLKLKLSAQEVVMSSMKAKKLNLSLKTNSKAANASLYVDEFILKEPTETDTSRLGIDSVRFHFSMAENLGKFSFNWQNKSDIPENFGVLKGAVEYEDLDKYKISLDTLGAIINDSMWSTLSSASVAIDSSSIQFDSLQFVSNHQGILVDGVLAETLDKGFMASFKNFNISAFNTLTRSAGISFDGRLTGEFQLIDAYRTAGFLTNLELDDFVLNGEPLGDALLKSTWNSDESIFLNLNLRKHGNKNDYTPLYLEGYYFPRQNENQLDLDVFVQNLPINFLNPFLESFVSDLEGNTTGQIAVRGSVKEPDIDGRLDFARTQFRIKYLNTLYTMSGTLNLDNEMIGFDEINLYDTTGNVALLHGGLSHNHLRKFGVDLNVKPQNFVALNTFQGMNELFYGKAVVTGELMIKGPFDNVFLDIKASSKRGTDLKIPISTTMDVNENSFIVFVNKGDTLNKKKEESYVPELSNFSLNMDLNVNNDAKVEISLPSQLGEIQATGSGDLNMSLSRTGNFRMSGDYRVDRGSFFFRIRNLLNRRFDLNEGGTISWTGDPYSGVLGMSANYQLKTSLNSLGLDQDSSYRNRVPVDCIIGLSGPIMDPNIRFRFEFPNATEEVKQYVYSKIDTTNSSEMSQQMLSLLIFNSFSFNNGTGDNSLANNVTGSSMQIVANQLSNWLSQISKDVDIGINYRPGSELTNEEVEVALSTQLWDERVTIDGNFGYQNIQDNPSANTSSIVGDINVEVKLTKDGRLRLKAFNRTNTVDLLDNTSPYTQGVGIFYRKEFNNLKELFTNQRKKDNENQDENKDSSKARINEEEESNQNDSD
jgi:hypothetical protein